MKTLLFDFDGTLVCTDNLVISSFNHIFKEYSFPQVPIERVKRTFGGLLIDEISTLAKEYKIDANPEDMIKEYRRYHDIYFEEKVYVYDGVKEALEYLKNKGYKMAVITSRKKSSAYRGLKLFDIEKYFSFIRTADDSTYVKPDKMAILSVIEEMNVDKNDCIMIGDSSFDIECAFNAQVKGIHAIWGREFSQEEIEKTGAEKIAKTPLEMIEIIEKW